MNYSNLETHLLWKSLINSNNRFDIGQFVEEFNNLFLNHIKQIKEEKQYSDCIVINDEVLRDAVLLIPQLLKLLELNIRPFEINCRSCIISDDEVRFAQKLIIERLFEEDLLDSYEEKEFLLFKDYCNEVFFSIAYILKLKGFELFKPSEQLFVNNKLAEKLAKSIHSRYSKLMLDLIQNPSSKSIYKDLYIVDDKNQQYFSMDFDQLPDPIKSSNIDNAYHIPTKLLSIGFEIRESKVDEEIPLLFLSEEDVETMAMVEHIRWSWEKRLNGFRFAPIRNDSEKKHHCLIPYDELPEVEKEKDRILVRLIPSLLQDIGYVPMSINPELKSTIHYPQRAQAKVHHIKHNLERLLKDITDVAKSNGIELPQSIIDSFQETILDSKEVGAGFSIAGTIQRTFLPSALFFRECLPDSFLLFKPKDIVCGDFYFVSKKDDSVVYITADCTGHGIQGAMLSAICYNYIDQAVNDKSITDPAEIIANVMPRVEYLMRRSEDNIENKSGMELAVCKLYPKTGILEYAGLNRPVYYFTNNQLNELVATKYRESFEQIAQSIQTQSIRLNPNDTIYTFSDGFADQFGGEKDNGGERFKAKRFKELLDQIQSKTMIEQREALNQTIEQWRQQAKQEQTDDIIIIGVKI